MLSHVTVCVCNARDNEAIFSPSSPCEMSVHSEPTLGNLRHIPTDVQPEPNSAPIGRSTTGGVYKEQGRNQHQPMTRKYWEFFRST